MTAKPGCWTCKERKIRCDKGLPHCDNCFRAKRNCQGYTPRLIWPDNPRRRQPKAVTLALRLHDRGAVNQNGSQSSDVEFLNFTSEDIRSVNYRQPCRPLAKTCLPNPLPALNLHPIVGQDASLLTYYERRISTMISTVQTQNGFCQDLLPMALASSGHAALALSNAMLAISAYHLYGSASALPYKAKAVSHLSLALRSNSEATETQMAASMMLCVYSVFDEVEGNFNVHLDGAKRMFRKQRRLVSEFILTWFLYHEVLGCFTRPSRLIDDKPDMSSLVQAAVDDPTLIIGSLGCSLETITIIHRINKMRLKYPNLTTSTPSPSAAKERLIINTQLFNLTQTLPSLEVCNQARTLAIAELYRIAAILYLQRVCPMPEDTPRRYLCLQQAFSLLDALEVATSPWPVFVIACESTPSDEQRIKILKVLDRMDEERGIGNVRVMRTLVETFWKRFDLGGLVEGAWARWWDDGDSAVAEPWFI